MQLHPVPTYAKALLGAAAAGAVLIAGAFFSYTHTLRTLPEPEPLTQEEQQELDAVLDGAFPERTQGVHALPYHTVPAKLDVWAGSAIIIDTATGSVLYEKNADEVIPPASMTKLMVMYIIFKEIHAGTVSPADIVPLPPECWAVNLPSDASRMFLNAGQQVTLDEILTGLAVDSGNDAAIAAALYISGSMDTFVERMNREAQALGLVQTRFVEPSGYDEHNLTTAREFASFARRYVSDFPEALEKYHSRHEFTYPQPHNLPQYPEDKVQSITQYNTNKLLRLLPGCDGLKTGFIYESRYNLALTAQRNGVRFLSVTMKGSGVGSVQGNNGRIHDGTQMMEWAFASFADYHDTDPHRITVAVPGGSRNTVTLVPVLDTSYLTVPFITGATPQDAARSVTVQAEVPPYISETTKAGEIYGTLIYRTGQQVLRRVPLAADRTVERGPLIRRAAGKLAAPLLQP